MTNQFPDVRSQAASSLTSDLVSQYPEACKQVVPYLVNLLNDPDQNVRLSATNELKELDPQAAAQAGIK
jgi:HEAT repeat protein